MFPTFRLQRRVGSLAIALGVQMVIAALALFALVPGASARANSIPARAKKTSTSFVETTTTLISATSTIRIATSTTAGSTSPVVSATVGPSVAAGQADPPPPAARPTTLPFTGNSERPAAVALGMLGLGVIALGLARGRAAAIGASET